MNWPSVERLFAAALLGTPSLEVGGSPARGAGGQRKPLALLSLLAVVGERGLSRDRLVAYLWPEGAADRETDGGTASANPR